jgi:hypothetical protein
MAVTFIIQMAIEDAGVLSMLIQRLCKPTPSSPLNYSALDLVCTIYEKIRLPRTTAILAASHRLGAMQMSRSTSENWWSTIKKEVEIKMRVAWNGTLPIMLNGSGWDYRGEVEKELRLNAKL